MVNLYILIQNYLVDQVSDFSVGTMGFREISYDGNGKACLGSKVMPTLARVNEISGSFEESAHYGRDRIIERDDWTWQLLMCFPRKVELESFKDEVISNGLRIARTDDNPPVWLDFTSFSVSHGVEEQGSSDGTEIVFTINAQVERYR